jgi:predicted lysophospholipase L1 biosynthesis ABC-type transport system permease subunit
LKTVDMQIEETHFLDRLLAWLSVAFGLLATLLASTGLYGLTGFNVTRRTQEIGIRMALGAERGNVLRLVMREVLILAAVGLIVGVPATLALGRLLESQLFEIKAGDPVVMAGATAVVLLVSMLAGYIPARRRHGSTQCWRCAGSEHSGTHRPTPTLVFEDSEGEPRWTRPPKRLRQFSSVEVRPTAIIPTVCCADLITGAD